MAFRARTRLCRSTTIRECTQDSRLRLFQRRSNRITQGPANLCLHAIPGSRQFLRIRTNMGASHDHHESWVCGPSTQSVTEYPAICGGSPGDYLLRLVPETGIPNSPCVHHVLHNGANACVFHFANSLEIPRWHLYLLRIRQYVLFGIFHSVLGV